MSAVILDRPVRIGSDWIISRRDDLAWFVGGPLAGYLALGLAMLAPSSVFTPFTLFWTFCINGPHFFATASRTYFDREQRRNLSWLLLMIVPLSR